MTGFFAMLHQFSGTDKRVCVGGRRPLAAHVLPGARCERDAGGNIAIAMG
jgi:hypothetical protein